MRALSVPLDVGVAAALIALLDRLALERQNLTAIDGLAEGVDRHLADSLVGLRVPQVAEAADLIDIGAGAGFPGLPLAAARPDVRVTLVESERRKAEWLTRASATFPNVRIVADRSEHLAERRRERGDVAIARALGPPAVALELAAPLIRTGGAVVLWRGRRDADADAGADRAAALLGLEPGEEHEVTPFSGAERRLQVFVKTSATPTRFPRRPGRAAKRPL